MGRKWGSQGLDFDITIDPSLTTRNTTWMPLSVRDVGSAIAVTYSQLYFLRRTKKAKMCTVYQAFRECLAQVSLRLSNQLLGRPDTSLTVPTVSDISLEPQLASFVEWLRLLFYQVKSKKYCLQGTENCGALQYQ
ncbi:hypothetical protein QAD02_001642 [Eretmocerus hayati]|uniref:Uncharacterized protein n=1 Tax=Eretmocerus hayati TaxID=131215 RepID=A0ACC2NHU9_9HYME|nr:hypothetical protein QAD02_001642 [Eretmocerus hayati]